MHHIALALDSAIQHQNLINKERFKDYLLETEPDTGMANMVILTMRALGLIERKDGNGPWQARLDVTVRSHLAQCRQLPFPTELQ